MKFVAFIFLGSLLFIAASCAWHIKHKQDVEDAPEKLLMLTGGAAIVTLITGFLTAVYVIARM